jgi:hypothetical protein
MHSFIGLTTPRVFLSYARKDGEAFATNLRRRLQEEESEITLWQDRAEMEGGVGCSCQSYSQRRFELLKASPKEAPASELTEAGVLLLLRSRPYLERLSLPVGAGGGGGGAFSHQQAETPSVAAVKAAKTKYLTKFIVLKPDFQLASNQPALVGVAVVWRI